jgi:hypothetical protein
MTMMNRTLAGLAVMMSAVVAAGCAGPASMTPEQKAGVELRRYCEQNPNDTVRCLGFLGFH